MRTIGVLGAAAALAVGLAACSSGGGSGSGTTGGSVKGKTISFVPGVSGDSFYITMQCGIQAEAAKNGMKVDMQAPQQFDASLQTPIVNGVIAKKPAGMLIAPTDAKAMVPPLLRAKQAGITIGLVDTTLAQSGLAVTGVSTDNKAGGAAAADALAKLIGQKGKVLVIAFKAGASTSDDRQHGFEQEIKKYSGIQYLGAQINDNSPAKAASIISATLAAHPDLTGVFATNQFAAEGAATGLRNAGKQNKVKVVGFDAGPVQVQQLQRGDVQALVAQQPYQIGTQAVDQLVASLTGKKPTAEIGTTTTTITKDDLSTDTGRQAVYKTTC
ncbi:ABC transporter substrate-binding protein [Actinoallomurus rhizosphaericola]|uniref:ABC transporter substrate-binding protein n=1 Tax=Actinoallomurus rhizosphaericola TaxID=2952536 RepID=UPI002093DEE6|nr:ABC transporter substrate-binding protein [Actinoallomurus rhizosphaericola]MCO6000079.1 ABC transporter substrate-binding protein [Actinoallomurus rhizosphaericola]